MHRAPCILEALRLRHRVQAGLKSGRSERSSLVTPGGIASVDLRQHATVHQVFTTVPTSPAAAKCLSAGTHRSRR